MVRFVIEKDKQRPYLEKDIEDVFKRPTVARVRTLFKEDFVKTLWNHRMFQEQKKKIKNDLYMRYGNNHTTLFDLIEKANIQ